MIAPAQPAEEGLDREVEAGLHLTRRITVAGRRPVAVRVQPLLHQQGVAQDELQQCVGATVGIRPAAQRDDE